MELKLFDWFQQERKRHSPINGPIVKIKAIELHKSYYTWLTRYEKRIVFKKNGEKLYSKSEFVAAFIDEFKNLIAQNSLNKNAIFKANVAFFWKILIDKTCVHSGVKTMPDRKLSKKMERCTFVQVLAVPRE